MATAIDIVIRAKDATVAAWNSVSKNAAAFGKRISAGIGGAVDIAKKAAVAVGILGAAVGMALKKVVAAAMLQAQMEAKLQAVLKATGYAAGFTASQLKKEAAELQKATAISDEAIISTQALLATFVQVRGDNFKRATVAILDMSSAMKRAGADSATVENAAIQVGKALNDPINGMNALKRVGVSFTDSQRAQIKALQEAGKLQEAQAVILAELENEFGGVAAAMGNATHGLELLKETFGDTLEAIGSAILGVDSFDDAIAKITKALEDLQASGQIDLWAERAAKAFSTVRQEVGYLIDWMKPLFEAIGGGIRNVSAFAGALSVRMGEASKDPLWKKMTGVTAVNMIRGAAADAGESRATDEQQIAKEEAQALEAIKARKDAEAAAVEAKEKAEMAAAQKVGAAKSAIEDAEGDGTDAAQKAVDAEKEKQELAADRVKLEKEAAQIAKDAADDAHRAEAAAAIKGADDTIEAAGKRLDELAMSTDEQREAEKARRQDAFDDRRLKRLRAKEEKGGRLSKFERDYLERGKLKLDVAAAEEEKRKAEQNLQQMDRDEAAKRRKEMVDRLTSIEAKLAQNLQAV
jgi:hypothetical protein